MNRWLKEFILLVVISAILSGIAYYIQDNYYSPIDGDIYTLGPFLIRMLRMITIYVLPVMWFQKRHNGKIGDLGVLPSKNYPVFSLLGGTIIYFIAIYVFLKYQIFFGGWKYLPSKIVFIKLLMIGVMASITDFWTRGFILFELQRRYNDRVAILWQNIVWFTIHVYEIELLDPYIGYLFAIILTLVLGVGGDLIALKTKSITGLMLGHILLNVSVAFAARGELFFAVYS